MQWFRIQGRRNNHGPDDDTHKTTRTDNRAGRARVQWCGLRADQSSHGESRRAKRGANCECFRGAIHIYDGEGVSDIRHESEESDEQVGDAVHVNDREAVANLCREPKESGEPVGDAIDFDIRSRQAASAEQAGSGADNETTGESSNAEG